MSKDSITEITVGENDRDFENMLNDFLERMSKVDHKLSMQIQKKILRDSTAEAVRSLRSRIRSVYKKHTGYAARSVRAKTAEHGLSVALCITLSVTETSIYLISTTQKSETWMAHTESSLNLPHT